MRFRRAYTYSFESKKQAICNALQLAICAGAALITYSHNQVRYNVHERCDSDAGYEPVVEHTIVVACGDTGFSRPDATVFIEAGIIIIGSNI